MATPDASFQQALRNNRLLTHLLLGQAGVIIVLVIAIVSLLPLKSKEFVLYEFSNGGNNFVKITKAGEEIRSRPLLIAHFLRAYVQAREPINKVDEAERYAAVVRAMSSDKIFSAFRAAYGNKSSPLYKDGFKRSIEIVRDSAIDAGIHQIEFKTKDSTDGVKGENVQEWVANIAYTFDAQAVSFDDRHFNPIGMIITEYTLSSRSTGK